MYVGVNVNNPNEIILTDIKIEIDLSEIEFESKHEPGIKYKFSLIDAEENAGPKFATQNWYKKAIKMFTGKSSANASNQNDIGMKQREMMESLVFQYDQVPLNNQQNLLKLSLKTKPHYEVIGDAFG